jgi:hypothetical protein
MATDLSTEGSSVDRRDLCDSLTLVIGTNTTSFVEVGSTTHSGMTWHDTLTVVTFRVNFFFLFLLVFRSV